MNLPARIVTSIGMIALIAFVFWGCPPIIFSVGVACFAALGLFELLTMLKEKGIHVYRFFGVSMGAILPLVVHFQYGLTEAGEVLFIVLSCFGLFLIQFARREDPRALEGIALTFFGVMYIGWFLSFMVKLLFLPSGMFLIIYLMAITKIGDIAAYFIGTWWGKHGLIPHISPKKSVEGTIAGLVASGLASLILGLYLPVALSVAERLILGIALGLIAQCGDLSESLIKRFCGYKDSGKSLPGFGGVLDLMDSVLFTTPLFYFYVKAHF